MKQAIARAIEVGPSHAYLFSGPPSSGKYEAAMEFAASVLCSNDSCDTCRRIREGVHPDVLIFEPEGTSYLVEQIRTQVVPEASLVPVEANHRFLIIRKAELLNAASSNALLKTLEEPLGHVTFILLSTPDAVLETIRSRCQVVTFDSLSPAEMVRRLEAAGFDSEEAQRAARVAGGRIDRALRNVLTARDRVLAIPTRLRTGPLASAIEAGAEIRSLVDDYASEEGERARVRRERGELLIDCLDILDSWYRDVALIQAGADDALLVNPEWRDQLEQEAQILGPTTPLRAHDYISQTRREWSRNPREDLWLERLMVALHALENS